MDTARLRRTFRYANDDDDDLSDGPEFLDEQEQDELIQSLAKQNKDIDRQFLRFLQVIPVLAMLTFVVVSITSSAHVPSMVLMLGVTSLGATLYLNLMQPLTQTGFRALDIWSGSVSAKGKSPIRIDESPIQRFLPGLNIGLCLLPLVYLLLRRSSSSSSSSQPSPAAFLLLASLPAILYAVMLVSKVIMAGVNPERDLGSLRYEYRGA